MCALTEMSQSIMQRVNCGAAELQDINIPCQESELRNLKSQHILYVEAKL